MIHLLDHDEKPIATFPNRSKLWKYLMGSLSTTEFMMIYFDPAFDSICKWEVGGSYPIFYLDFVDDAS